MPKTKFVSTTEAIAIVKQIGHDVSRARLCQLAARGQVKAERVGEATDAVKKGGKERRGWSFSESDLLRRKWGVRGNPWRNKSKK